MLKQIGLEITSIPQGFHVHRTIQRFLENRRQAMEIEILKRASAYFAQENVLPPK